jgi:hypothetical protein
MMRLVILSFLIVCLSCNRANVTGTEVEDDPSKKASYEPLILAKPLLASRFKSLDDFKSKVQVKYFNKPNDRSSKVQLYLKTSTSEIRCELKSGLSQKDIMKVQKSGIADKLKFTMKSPYSIRNRKKLEKVYVLGRRRTALFGLRDAAFYDLALVLSRHINTKEIAYKNEKDSSEKGYINTFNHITAQALITSMFTKELASFVADVHERKNMPELTTGYFSPEQLQDTLNYPEDNYVDIINNKIGQDIGLVLKEKYKLNSTTIYTPELLANYLNDLQNYFSWSMGIGLDSFKPSDEVIVRFTHKINFVLQRNN